MPRKCQKNNFFLPPLIFNMAPIHWCWPSSPDYITLIIVHYVCKLYRTMFILLLCMYVILLTTSTPETGKRYNKTITGQQDDQYSQFGITTKHCFLAHDQTHQRSHDPLTHLWFCHHIVTSGIMFQKLLPSPPSLLWVINYYRCIPCLETYELNTLWWKEYLYIYVPYKI